MFDTLIFDFGQVIVHFDPIYMTKQYITDEEDIKTVADVVFDRLYWDRLDEGSITDEEVKTAIVSRLPERLGSVAAEVYDNWIYNIPIIEGMYELIKEQKEKGKALYLLSNISIGFAENYQKNPEIKKILDLFDGLCFSGILRIVKPSYEIFDYIKTEYSLCADNTIFIDDSPKNIKGAEDYGIKGYLFDGDIKKLREYLNS